MFRTRSLHQLAEGNSCDYVPELDDDAEKPLEKTNRELQNLFAERMKGVAKSRSHQNAAVLMLSWEKESEDYLDTTQEVRDLRQVFENSYHFKVHDKRLHAKKKKRASHQINVHIANFVNDEDGENTLLIVYYAGHGIQNMNKDDLILLGGNSDTGTKHLSQIAWNKAEQLLHEISSDLLLIFDCCYAGVLAQQTQDRSFSHRIFEFLGATRHDRVAVGPGDYSFTTALTWALSALASEPEGFTTSTLYQCIQRAPKFKDRRQYPVWSERGKSSLHRLKISPLSEERFNDSNASNASETGEDDKAVKLYLHLCLLWTDCPREEHIELLTNQLQHLIKVRGLPLKQVAWRGLSDKDHKVKLRDVARYILRSRRESRGPENKFKGVSNLGKSSNEEAEITASPEELHPPDLGHDSLASATIHLPKMAADALDQTFTPHAGPQKRTATDSTPGDEHVKLAKITKVL